MVAYKAVVAVIEKVQGTIEAASANMNELSMAAQKAQLDIAQYAALEYAADIIDFNVEALISGYAKITKLISDVNEKTAATFQLSVLRRDFEQIRYLMIYNFAVEYKRNEMHGFWES